MFLFVSAGILCKMERQGNTLSSFFTKGPDYFGLFQKGIQISDKAAKTLRKAFSDSRIDGEEIKRLQDIEHEGDRHVHECAKLISDAFITPIERPDMMNMIAAVEALTDSIDDIGNQIYMMHIVGTDETTEKFVRLIDSACGELCGMMKVFPYFKKNKFQEQLHEISIRVNHIEEEGDILFMNAMRSLFDPEQKMDTMDVIRRENLYNTMEDSLDCCEDVADIVQQIIISNT